MSSGGANQPTRSVMFEMFEKALADGAITKEQREAFNIISKEAKVGNILSIYFLNVNNL